MKCYIAGPMRGIALYNFPAFFDAAMHLRQLGHTVSNPAERDMAIGLNPSLALDHPDNIAVFDIGKAFEWDFQQILASDAIVLLPGWEDSKGVQAELLLATTMKRKAYTYNDDLTYNPLTDLDIEGYTVEFHGVQKEPAL